MSLILFYEDAFHMKQPTKLDMLSNKRNETKESYIKKMKIYHIKQFFHHEATYEGHSKSNASYVFLYIKQLKEEHQKTFG